MSSPRSDLRLVIKTVDHFTSDFNVDCAQNCTVRELKKQLATIHPIKPPASQQRLVCAGKLLADHVKLSEAIGQIDARSRIAIHLVLSPHFQRSMSAPVNSSSDKATTGFAQSAAEREQHGLRQRGVQYRPAAFPFSYSPGFWMHPAYMHQMAAAAAASGQAPPPNTLQGGQYVNNDPSQDQTPLPAAAPPQPERGDQDRPANNQQILNANAAGAFMGQDEEDEDEAAARDWLDKIYTLFRVGLLLTIFYFYSSSFRFTLAIVIIILIFLYQCGWFKIRRRVRGNAPQGAQQQQQANRNEQADQVRWLCCYSVYQYITSNTALNLS
jgi:hypothetical protein